MNIFALGRLKNHKRPHFYPNFTMSLSLDLLQLKIFCCFSMFVLNSDKRKLTQILLRQSEQKFAPGAL